jgi:hypothetical protein
MNEEKSAFEKCVQKAFYFISIYFLCKLSLFFQQKEEERFSFYILKGIKNIPSTF